MAAAGRREQAQALARSCAGRPDFLPCDGVSVCATHSHGRCFRLHWCCHLGWCHCKYVYQPMTSVYQLPSTQVPAAPSDCGNTDSVDLSVSLAERFLRTASFFQPPPCPESPKYCVISDLFVDDYMVKRINGKMCYVQRPPPSQQAGTTPSPQPVPQQNSPGKGMQANGGGEQEAPSGDKVNGPKMNHCSSPSSSEDSGINALGLNYLESCDEDSDVEEGDEELSTDGDSYPASLWDQDECSVLSPSKSAVEIIEKIETTV